MGNFIDRSTQNLIFLIITDCSNDPQAQGRQIPEIQSLAVGMKALYNFACAWTQKVDAIYYYGYNMSNACRISYLNTGKNTMM
jgi:hypothetical protein